MRSSPAGALPADHDVCAPTEWDALLAEVRDSVDVSPWARVSHLFTLAPAELDGSATGSLPSDVELLRRMRDCEALTTQLLAEQGRYLLELRRRRLVDQAVAHPHQDGACASACCDDDGWVAVEVGQELGLSERQVQARLDTAARVARHPLVADAMDDGRLQSWTATKLLEHLETLAAYVPPERLAEVEAATLAWLLSSTRTVTELNARMRRLVLAARAAARPDGGGEPEGPRADPLDARRHVTVTPAPTPGLAELVALLPEADALAIRATLHALGHDRADSDDPRTADQRRADLLVTLVTGHPALHGRGADARCALHEPFDVAVRLDVTVPADSLCGGAAPARVPGYGDVPAATARDLAQAGSTRGCAGRPLVYDPTSGALLGFGSTPVRLTWLDGLPASRGYAHSATLETAVRLRDGTCRAPGCTRAASRCDCDHVVPYPAGETSLANSCSLCRRHHRLKTHAPGWRLISGPDGQTTWTTPTGRRLHTYLADYRPRVDSDHPPDTPDPPF